MKKLLLILFIPTICFAQKRTAGGGVGTGVPVYATSPTLVTPNLGTPTTLVGTNITGTGASFTAGNVTTNANLTGDVSSSGNATTIGALKVTSGMIAANAATLAKLDASNATANKVLLSGASASPTWSGYTFSGTASQVYTFPTTTATLARTDALQTFTGVQTFSSAPVLSTGTLTSIAALQTFPTNASTVVGRIATADVAAGTSAVSATTLFTPTVSGWYRISASLKLTITGTSPVAGPITITYTDPDGSVAQSEVMLLHSVTGTVVTTTVNNSTTTGTVTGTLVIYAKTGVAIQYAIAVSGTYGAGRYVAHLACESLQ